MSTRHASRAPTGAGPATKLGAGSWPNTAYVCICMSAVCTCMYVHVCLCAYVYVYQLYMLEHNTWACLKKGDSSQVYIYKYTHTHIHTHTNKCLVTKNLPICAYTCTHTYCDTYLPTYLHTYMHMCNIHVHVPACFQYMICDSYYFSY